MYKQKVCKGCGATFLPTTSKQSYCKQPVERTCPICKTVYIDICQSKPSKTCGDPNCIKASTSRITKVCRVCNTEFVSSSARQLDCNRPITKNCVVCGAPFAGRCSLRDNKHTCDDPVCIETYRSACSADAVSKKSRNCMWCGKLFVPTHASQIYCDGDHYNTCVICNKKFPISKIVNLKDVRKTCSDECATKLRFLEGKQLSPEAMQKRDATMMERYGVKYPAQRQDFIDKAKQTYLYRTGFVHQSHNPVSRRAGIRSARESKLEKRILDAFNQYQITVIPQHLISSGDLSHVYDFYLPEYRLLIDADGIYYHSYLSDPDGLHVRDDYDEVRIKLIPENHTFHVIVEGDEERGIKWILDYIQNTDNRIYSYDTELFNWCRAVGFPYPEYSEKRMVGDYKRLVARSSSEYHPYARLGDSIIRHFHKSIYDASVKPYIPPKVAWEDDTLLRKVIANRLIYKNDVDPSKILAGFNISKLCPRVSIFNPMLAKYICDKYLSEYTHVFDPFSGFSGRLLGVTASGKYYKGQDLNSTAVDESNKIIQFLDLNASVTHQDILTDTPASYQCILTCPPYGDKEQYSTETVTKSCDEWITYILQTYRCSRYVFVVDKTNKFESNVVEEIKSPSHFTVSTEKLIIIDL